MPRGPFSRTSPRWCYGWLAWSLGVRLGIIVNLSCSSSAARWHRYYHKEFTTSNTNRSAVLIYF